MESAPIARWLRLEEAAERLGVTPETMARYCRDGVVPAARLPGPNGQYRIAEADVVLALRPAAEVRSAAPGVVEVRRRR